jgi:Mg2+ and Co2+ transporter CorA
MQGRSMQWLDYSGSCTSFDVFAAEIRAALQQHDLPPSFNRFFQDNGAMPFGDGDGKRTMGILLRYPDLNAEEGQISVSTISNRLVIIVALERRLLVTYHIRPIPALEDLRLNEHRLRYADAGTALEEIVRCIVGTFTVASHTLRTELMVVEAMSESNEVDAVRHMNAIYKQSNILERCSKASVATLLNVTGLLVYDEDFISSQRVSALCALFRTAQDTLEETKNNALSGLKLVMATTQFRSNVNFRLFTRIRVLTLPVAVATSWYGMNFEAMEELRNPNGYRGFMAVAVFSAVFIYVAVFYGVQMYDYLLARCCGGNETAATVRRREARKMLNTDR